MITMTALAEKAGVSRATVSHILHERDTNLRISEANKKRVLELAASQHGPNTRNNGGNLWVHGLKTEQNRTKIWTKNGATEVSAYVQANRSENSQPMFENIDSRFSLSVVESVLRKGPFAIKVRETRGGVTQNLTHEKAPKAGEGAMISLFVGGTK